MTDGREPDEPEKAPEQPPEKPYSTEQFAFVDETLDESNEEVSGWLSFMHSRAGRKVDRREQRQERIRLLGVTLALVALIGGVVLWSPWSSGGDAVDTGHEAMGADRVNVLLPAGRSGRIGDR